MVDVALTRWYDYSVNITPIRSSAVTKYKINVKYNLWKVFYMEMKCVVMF